VGPHGGYENKMSGVVTVAVHQMVLILPLSTWQEDHSLTILGIAMLLAHNEM
jgi:hypothetical protein